MNSRLLERKYYLLERLEEGGYPDKDELKRSVSEKMGDKPDQVTISDRMIGRDIEFLRNKLQQSIHFDTDQQGYVYKKNNSPVSDILSNFFPVANAGTADRELSKAV